MEQLITGIHHVTAIASNAQDNLDFYAGILGMRLVKKTVNFDGPEIYHFYYGDEAGNPGSILTFFSLPGIGKRQAWERDAEHNQLFRCIFFTRLLA
jgi:glyoxalase family protein